MVKLEQSLDISIISKAIEVNFSGIYTEKIIETMSNKEWKKKINLQKVIRMTKKERN